MSAHPMLQPVDWSRPPESLEREIAPDRLDVYRIVWNSAIAVTLRGPYLTYERTLFDVNGVTMSAMTVDASPSRRGYWPFRQNIPFSPWPQATSVPLVGPFKVTEARTVRASGISLGELILEMEARSIGTPATTASLLHTAIENEGRHLGPTLRLEWRNSVSPHDHRWMVRLSNRGKDALDKWKAADLVGSSIKRREDIELVADGEASPQEVLMSRFPDIALDVVERIQKSISVKCDRWRGLSQEDGLRAMTRQQARPPKLSGLPHWIDPELLLPQDHPLRRIRNEMEGDLAVRHPTWSTLSGEEKLRYRLEWLNAKRPVEASIPVLDSENVQFNALVHWLLGQPTWPFVQHSH